MKRQHAIDHPGYQYQPRKPSEKKKRMTKTKLAKLRAQNNTAAASDPLKELNEMLAGVANDKQLTLDQFQVPFTQGFSNLQPSLEDNNYLTFDTNGEQDIMLENQLHAWNADNQSMTSSFVTGPVVLESQPLANGEETVDVPQLDLPYIFTEADSTYEVFGVPTSNYFDPTAEIARQDALLDGYIDWKA